jgi:hypothetical protein
MGLTGRMGWRTRVAAAHLSRPEVAGSSPVAQLPFIRSRHWQTRTRAAPGDAVRAGAMAAVESIWTKVSCCATSKCAHTAMRRACAFVSPCTAGAYARKRDVKAPAGSQARRRTWSASVCSMPSAWSRRCQSIPPVLGSVRSTWSCRARTTHVSRCCSCSQPVRG